MSVDTATRIVLLFYRLIAFPQVDRAFSQARPMDSQSLENWPAQGKSRRLLRWGSCLDGELTGHGQATCQARITLEA